MKNYDQSKKAKEEFLRTSPLYGYMKNEPDRVYTKEELQETFDKSNRAIRNDVAELANYVPVISLSNKKGYRVLSFDANTPKEKLAAMLEDVDHQINEHKSRVDNLKARMKPLVAFKKVIEAKLAESK